MRKLYTDLNKLNYFCLIYLLTTFTTMTDSSFGKMSIIVNICQLTHDLNH